VLSILLPVDGSDNALRAVRHIIERKDWYQGPLELHLLNVQLPIASGLVKTFISKSQLDDYYRDEGLAALERARAELDAAKVPHHDHVGVGELAVTILDYVRDKKCDLVVMGTHGHGTLGDALLGSVASRVLHQATNPVLFVK
jgi:nucleotide-binding universal stress UspA family protein